MEKNICYIVGAGDFHGLDFQPRHNDYIIGADGGLKYLEQHGLSADLVIGDFDSLGQCPDHHNVIALNKEKDDTDTFAAVRKGIELGYHIFHLYCCTGGRPDHTLANIQLLAHLSEQNMQGFLFDKDSVITAIKNNKLTFNQSCKGHISVISHSDISIGVSIKGLKYELENADLTNTFPLGVSNEFVGYQSTISVKQGTLLIVFPKETKEMIL